MIYMQPVSSHAFKNSSYSGIASYLTTEFNRWNKLIDYIPRLDIDRLTSISGQCSHILNDLQKLEIPETLNTVPDLELFQVHTHKFRLIITLNNLNDAVLAQIDSQKKLMASGLETPFGMMVS